MSIDMQINKKKKSYKTLIISNMKKYLFLSTC